MPGEPLLIKNYCICRSQAVMYCLGSGKNQAALMDQYGEREISRKHVFPSYTFAIFLMITVILCIVNLHLSIALIKVLANCNAQGAVL